MSDKFYYLKVKQCVSGSWINLIDVGIEGKLSPEQATERLSAFTDKLYKSGKMHMTKQSESVVFNTDKWPVHIILMEGSCED